MPLMTTVHWIAVGMAIVLFLLFVVLAFKESNRDSRLSIILLSFFLVGIGLAIAIYGLDKVTKKGTLVTITHTRDFLKEQVVFQGKVKNEGKFTIGSCTLEVRILNDTGSGSGSNRSIFVPERSLADLFGFKEIKSNKTTEEFVVAELLEAGKSKNFKVVMPFPPYFNSPKYEYKIFCH